MGQRRRSASRRKEFHQGNCARRLLHSYVFATAGAVTATRTHACARARVRGTECQEACGLGRSYRRHRSTPVHGIVWRHPPLTTLVRSRVTRRRAQVAGGKTAAEPDEAATELLLKALVPPHAEPAEKNQVRRAAPPCSPMPRHPRLDRRRCCPHLHPPAASVSAPSLSVTATAHHHHLHLHSHHPYRRPPLHPLPPHHHPHAPPPPSPPRHRLLLLLSAWHVHVSM